jgi:hypothetical protein
LFDCKIQVSALKKEAANSSETLVTGDSVTAIKGH